MLRSVNIISKIMSNGHFVLKMKAHLVRLCVAHRHQVLEWWNESEIEWNKHPVRKSHLERVCLRSRDCHPGIYSLKINKAFFWLLMEWGRVFRLHICNFLNRAHSLISFREFGKSEASITINGSVFIQTPPSRQKPPRLLLLPWPFLPSAGPCPDFL